MTFLLCGIGATRPLTAFQTHPFLSLESDFSFSRSLSPENHTIALVGAPAKGFSEDHF